MELFRTWFPRAYGRSEDDDFLGCVASCAPPGCPFGDTVRVASEILGPGVTRRMASEGLALVCDVLEAEAGMRGIVRCQADHAMRLANERRRFQR